MSAASTSFTKAAGLLIQGEQHRVWSMIVTILGDLAQSEGDMLSGPALTRLTGLMGVKPEALRVALYRLRKDGWIDSRREGRTSQHYLSAKGRAESAAVTPRIYQRDWQAPTSWHLLLSAGQQAEGRQALEAWRARAGYISIGSHGAVGPGHLPEGLEPLFGTGLKEAFVPNWLRDQICPPPLQRDAARLCTAFAEGLTILQTARLDLCEATALRCLAVHSWRRLLLRHPDMPATFFPETWSGPRCRGLFCDLLDLLPPPSLAVLEAELCR